MKKKIKIQIIWPQDLKTFYQQLSDTQICHFWRSLYHREIFCLVFFSHYNDFWYLTLHFTQTKKVCVYLPTYKKFLWMNWILLKICQNHGAKKAKKTCQSFSIGYLLESVQDFLIKLNMKPCTPGPHLMRIHLVQYSTSVRYQKYSIIHLVRPIIHLVRIFALSTSWIN